AQGQERAPRLAEKAMRRLGFGGAWPAIAAHLLGRGPERDRLMYFSLDLSRSAAARVKLYVRHFAATGAVLEHVCAAAPGLQPGSVEEFCRALAGADGPFLQKAPVTCAAFVEDDVERPSTTTIYFPVAAYAPNDRVARDRIAGYLAQHALPLDAYTTPLDAFATRRLGDGAGMQSYASLRCGCARPRVTVYFSPEVFSGAEARARAAAAVPAGDLLEEHRRHPITDHPYFARLGQAPEAGQLWALQSNLQHAIVDPEPRRLSALTARVDDDRLRCLLVQHLNEVLGNGDFARARRRRFAQLLEAAGCRSADDAALASGRSLGRALDYYYVEAEVAEALGANLVVELYARQVESFLGVAERPAVSQVDTLARLLPPSGPALEAAWRGGRAIADAWRKFLDALPESAAA
ncbi:MAG TPA: hypothetical protein VFF06_33575, partial [Polyangia bacterium]|nr:hypothetical protein [Polyangia bacterium]